MSMVCGVLIVLFFDGGDDVVGEVLEFIVLCEV